MGLVAGNLYSLDLDAQLEQANQIFFTLLRPWTI